jgi:hypothetical protein
MRRGEWIGVDLDGTLATYDYWRGPWHIGEPIMPMVDRVKYWLSQGYEVRIFTARVSHDGTPERITDAEIALASIQAWCSMHIGQVLRVTNQKDFGMAELWDDRAVQVVRNVGEFVGYSTRGIA